MKPYELLEKQPAVFKNLTGVALGEFIELHHSLVPLWADDEHKRLSRSDRQRAIGGGHPYTLELKDQLLMTLFWVHLRLTTAGLSCLFGVDKATVSRNTRRIWQILSQSGQSALAWPSPPRRGHSKNLNQACRDHPDLLAMIQLLEQANLSSSASNPAASSASKPIDFRYIYRLSSS
jgi:hypothetical protein